VAEAAETVDAMVSPHAGRPDTTERQALDADMSHYVVDDNRARRGPFAECLLADRIVTEVIGRERTRMRVDIVQCLISRAEEIGYVLNGYDIDSEWPPGSGIPYLEYFAPVDYAAGRRLAGCAAQLWKALMELSPESARRHLEFPMQHVAKATEAILFQLARGEDWGDVTSHESWLRELAKANFPDHMRIISTGS